MEIAREDWLLIFIVAAVVLPLGYSAVTSSGFVPETELEKECVSYADAVEKNASAAGSIKECSCIPPKRVNEDRLPAPQKVKDASTAFLITCKLDSGGELGPFAIWRVRDNYTGSINQTNATVLRDSP